MLNKVDLWPHDEVEARKKAIVEALGWEGPCFAISAVSNIGVQNLVNAMGEKILRKDVVERDY